MLLLRRARELERHLPGAIAGDDVGVHQARVASRRLREAVPVLAADTKSRKKAERKIRRVTQALGMVREMDVTVQILDEFARGAAIPRDALEDVRAHVIAERDRRRADMLDRLRRVNTAKLNRRLEEVSIMIPGATLGEWRGALVARVGSRAKRLRTAIHKAGQVYAAEQLHVVRIATKKLRYALELVADSRLAAVRPLLGTLKRAQETLGRLHDLQVIEQHVGGLQALPPSRRGAHDGGLDVMARKLADECRHLHARYIKQVPALLDLADKCATAVVPQVTAAPAFEDGGHAKLARPSGQASLTVAALELYLIRHGIAAERGPEYPDDSKRPLTGKGIAALKREAKALNGLGVTFDLIITSPLTRTRQTAEVFAEHLEGKPTVSHSDALAPAGTPAAVMQEIAKHARKARIALVGHEPNIGELAARLIGARSPIQFKKGAICRIDFDVLPPKALGQLRWFMPPRVLRNVD